ncbi:MAG: N-acetylmuramoyl-L-alanine amidase [Thermoanaerobaculia bacterium]|nr:N-acetylmuramoyl-L-alanine amidase [Thermoanaerobaculia bacterium]
MKRFSIIAMIAAAALASIVMAQSEHQATLRTAAGDKPLTFVQQSGQTYVSAFEVIAGLGGSIAPDATGYKVTIGDAIAAFGPDSRYGVVREDLIEMPVPPITIEGKPFVPWQFFSGLLTRTGDLDATWDVTTHVLIIHPRQMIAVPAQVTVTDIQGISKIVVTLAMPLEYTISREPAAYTIRFRGTLQAPFADESYEDPRVAKASFNANVLRIDLKGPDIAGDAYRLENPFRIVLDLRQGAAHAPGTTPLTPGPRLRDAPGIRTIVIDPGHGGKDVGAAGPNGLLEKDVTLAVARKLSSALERIGARVILTREDDSIVSLDQRTAIANQYDADLFLSVHMNAAVVKGAKGSETYFLSLEASDEVARRAAETENASAAHALAGASDLKLILWDLAQQEYLQESSRFAQAIQEELNKATGVQNRGVKQAPFKVLVGATMPAALVEVGFISNPDEEAKLQTDGFQNSMVEALVRAVERYKGEYETRAGLLSPPAGVPPLTGGMGRQPKSRTGT